MVARFKMFTVSVIFWMRLTLNSSNIDSSYSDVLKCSVKSQLI